MGEFFTQLNFTQIAGQPHDIPEKAIDKLMTFNGTDASISAEQHIRNFSRHFGSYVRGANKYEDVYMTLFALSLDGLTKVQNSSKSPEILFQIWITRKSEK